MWHMPVTPALRSLRITGRPWLEQTNRYSHMAALLSRWEGESAGAQDWCPSLLVAQNVCCLEHRVCEQAYGPVVLLLCSLCLWKRGERRRHLTSTWLCCLIKTLLKQAKCTPEPPVITYIAVPFSSSNIIWLFIMLLLLASEVRRICVPISMLFYFILGAGASFVQSPPKLYHWAMHMVPCTDLIAPRFLIHFIKDKGVF